MKNKRQSQTTTNIPDTTHIFSIQNLLITMLIIRFIAGIFYSLTPLHGLHVWRQTDVLGVSYSYYLRFFVEGNFGHFFLPSVLNTNNGEFGIVKMEFPLLNMILMPVFALGPYWGKFAANIIVLVINYALVFINCRLLKNVKIYGVPALLPLLLLLNFSFTATWTTRILPDVFAMLLVLTAVNLSWKKPRILWSSILASLGILIKPTSIVVILLILLKNDTFSKTIRSKIFLKDLIWSLIGLIIGLIYYFLILKYIGQFQTQEHFAIGFSSPIQHLKDFFLTTDEMNISYLLSYRLLGIPFIEWQFNQIMTFFPFFGIIIWTAVIIINAIIYKKIFAWRAFIVFLIQFFTIASLDGSHSFVHFYYYVGTTFALSIFFMAYLTNGLKWLKPLLILILILQLYDVCQFEIGDYYLHHFQWSAVSRVAFYDECAQLKDRHPEFPWHSGYVFNGPLEDNHQAPALGICFGERERLNGANYGFYFKWDEVPGNCQVIDYSEHILLTHCN